MKKFTKILALSLALIMSVMMLASCAIFGAKPAKDPEKAKDALKDNDYNVQLIDDKDALEGYAEMNECGKLTAVVVGANEDEEFISILYFEDASDAKKAYEDSKEELKEMQEEDDDYKDYVCGRSGKMVWMASSKDAVKAAK